MEWQTRIWTCELLTLRTGDSISKASRNNCFQIRVKHLLRNVRCERCGEATMTLQRKFRKRKLGKGFPASCWWTFTRTSTTGLPFALHRVVPLSLADVSEVVSDTGAMAQALSTSETLVTLYENTQRKFPVSHLHTRHYENLTCHFTKYYLSPHI
jgi:hypothetical protein